MSRISHGRLSSTCRRARACAERGEAPAVAVPGGGDGDGRPSEPEMKLGEVMEYPQDGEAPTPGDDGDDGDDGEEDEEEEEDDNPYGLPVSHQATMRSVARAPAQLRALEVCARAAGVLEGAGVVGRLTPAASRQGAHQGGDGAGRGELRRSSDLGQL
jgi:hypothetical protein